MNLRRDSLILQPITQTDGETDFVDCGDVCEILFPQAYSLWWTTSPRLRYAPAHGFDLLPATQLLDLIERYFDDLHGMLFARYAMNN